MSKADELLNSIDETDVPSDNVTEEHIVIDDYRRISVPEPLKRIGIQYDHNVETVTFDCPRYWDGHDMSEMGIYINYSRADGVSGSYIATNVRIDEDDESIMHFDWVVSRNVTMTAGKISFLVCIKDVNEKGQETIHWNSEMCSDMYVSEGLECAPVIYRQYADIIEHVRSHFANYQTDEGIKALRDRINTSLSTFEDEIRSIRYNINTSLSASEDEVHNAIENIRTKLNTSLLEFEIEIDNTAENIRTKLNISKSEMEDEINSAVETIRVRLNASLSEIENEVLQFVDNLGISQNAGYDETKVMSQKAVTKEFSKCFNDEIVGANVVDPKLLQNLGYYYDFNDGVTPKENAYCFITVEKIPFNGTKLTTVASPEALEMIANGTSSPVSPTLYIYHYGENGYISGRALRIADLPITNKVPTGTTHILVYSNFDNMPMGAVCIRSDTVKEYVPYQTKKVLKEECLPTESIPPLYGKKIVNMGDSIFGNARPPQDVSTYLQNISGATVYNCAFGGCRMSSHNGHWDAFSMYRLADAIASGDWSLQDEALLYDDRVSYAEEPLALLKTLDFNDIDILTINYGTNDWSASKHIDTDTDVYDAETFLGALRYSVKKIQEAYPALKIVILSVTWRCQFDADRNVIQDISSWGNGNNVLLGEFYDAQKNCAFENGLQFIDLISIGINKYNAIHYFDGTDGTHQNEQGRLLIAKHLAHELF